jgi:hypothetical protein
MQTLDRFAQLRKFVLDSILPRLLVKMIWNDEELWEGFLRLCVKFSSSMSLALLDQLPQERLQQVFKQSPELEERMAML